VKEADRLNEFAPSARPYPKGPAYPVFWQRERPLREYRKVIPAECIMEMIEGGAEINYVDAEN
jgi:hypothetical protein